MYTFYFIIKLILSYLDEYRLLMRRDVMLNVICNHNINLVIGLNNRGAPNVLIWAGLDFSEKMEGESFNFTLRLKVMFVLFLLNSLSNQVQPLE